jgi:hypothetical protein
MGTAGNPSPQIPGVTAGAKTPNSGGIIQKGAQETDYPADPAYTGPAPTGFLKKGIPAPLTPANRPPQTERADPLSGAGGPPQLTGTSRTVSTAPAIDPGKALGASTRGNMVPKGEDRHPPQQPDPDLKGGSAGPDGWIAEDPNKPGGSLNPDGKEDGEEEDDKHNDDETIGGHVGGSGAAAAKFGKPTPGSAYQSYLNGATGAGQGAKIFSGRATGKPASNVKAAGPRDNGNESDGGEDY